MPAARLDGESGAHQRRHTRRLLRSGGCGRVLASDLREQFGPGGELARLGEGIGRQHAGKVEERDLGQTAQRQPQADRRIARHQEQVSAPEGPALGEEPAPAAIARRHDQRQHVADRRPQALVEHPHQALALCRVVERVVLGRDAERQLLLDQHEVRPVLVGGNGAVGGQSQAAAKLGGKPRGIVDVGRARRGLLGDQRRVLPQRHPVRRASKSRTPSAPSARPDTTCPGRSAAARPAPAAHAGGAPACRHRRAWSAPAHRCSTRAPGRRRGRRRSARRRR